MPQFCRHNRFIQNCPICREPEPAGPPPRRRAARAGATRSGASVRARRTARGSGDVRVRRVARATEDGYASPLVPGLRASADAERLAAELTFAAGRLAVLASDPPGLYAEAAAEPDREEGLWLAAQIAFLAPLEGDDPFATVRAVRVPWAGGGVPEVGDAPLGPRSPFADGAAASRGLAAYRAWAERAGSQAAALEGDPGWPPERRFARAFERLGTLPGAGRPARFDLLLTAGRLGLLDARAGALFLGDRDDASQAAKRVFAIADRLLLERRAAALAEAAEVPLEALDLALANLARTPAQGRVSGGVDVDVTADDRARIGAALGL